MKPIVNNIYTLLMFLAYVMRRAGTFSLEEKVEMIEFLSHMALNPNKASLSLGCQFSFSRYSSRCIVAR
jgi:hypothetical protein